MAPLFGLIGIVVAVAIVDVVLRIWANRPKRRRVYHSDSGEWISASSSAYARGGALIDMGRRGLKTAPTRFVSWIKRAPFESARDRLAPAVRTLFARNPRDFRVMARSAVRAFRRRDDGF
jgi:hypothetical protein